MSSQHDPSSSGRDIAPARPGMGRMAGSSIAGHGAGPWITDFLNAACYRRPVEERDVDDLRLAFAIVTTYWNAKAPDRRLGVTDLRAFHRAFWPHRIGTEHSGRGLLQRTQLLEGGARLLGDWFPDAYADGARRGWGIAFPTEEARAAHDPERRLALARLGELTPAEAAPEEQTWHTYDPVELPSAERALAALSRPETWPDYASEIGRFTPLRAGGLPGQTFEIEVAAGTEVGLPIFTRGYVTATQVLGAEDPGPLTAFVDGLDAGLAAHGDGEPRAVPEGGTPVAAIELTTHAGHFMGAAYSRLLVFEHAGRAWIRDVGVWDPMPWTLAQAYRVSGAAAQHAFWGGGAERLSMLHQLARAVA